MKVLRVLPSISSATGGLVRSTLANCRAVHAADSEVRFTLAATDVGLDPDWREAIETRMPPGMEVKLFAGRGENAFIFSAGLLRWLRRHVESFDIIVVETLLNPVSSTAAWAARQSRVPYIVVPHGMLSRYTFAHRRTLLKRIYFRLIERRTLAGAAAIRFTTEGERSQAPLSDGLIRTTVIPHSFEPRFDIGADRQEKPGQILFLSRWDPKKGFDVLLKAFQNLRELEPSAYLVLAGSGTARYERDVCAELARLDIDEAVALPGFVEGEAKTEYLRSSSVFVLPSHQENFGIAVVEAMDAGLPVVISKGVDIWPEVEAAGAGIVVKPRTPESVTAALSTLLGDSELRREMGRNGQQLVHSKFDPLTVGAKLVDLYRFATKKEPHDPVEAQLV